MSNANYPLSLRFNKELRKHLEEAAHREGLPFSTWLKMIAKKEADKINEKVLTKSN